MTTPEYPFSKAAAPGQPPPSAGYQYGPQGQPGLPSPGPTRRRGSFGPALIVAAVGLALQAVSQLIYWPTDDYSLDKAKFGTAVSALSWIVLAVAAVLAATVASRRD